MNSIFHRISVRKYQDRPVEKEKIEQPKPYTSLQFADLIVILS